MVYCLFTMTVCYYYWVLAALRARILSAPVFLGYVTRQRGRCALCCSFYSLYNGLPARFPVLGNTVKALVKAARESQLGFSYVNIYWRMAHSVLQSLQQIQQTRECRHFFHTDLLHTEEEVNIDVVAKYLQGCQLQQGSGEQQGNYTQRHILKGQQHEMVFGLNHLL